MATPAKLQKGDVVRVISPSRSLGIISDEVQQIAIRRLEELGLTVSFGTHASVMGESASSSVEERLEDLHEAFRDPAVTLILTSIGGFNANQLLPYIDYDFVRSNPKILCGYSDITALANALYAKTGLVTYSGPHFSSFGQERHFDYTLEHFRRCVIESAPFEVTPAEAWSDDEWYKDQEQRKLEPNDGYWVINEGSASGTVLGGNLCTFNLLQGTPYMPSLQGSILFLEDDSVVDYATFERDLVSLTQQPGFDAVRGIVIGRFQRASGISRADIERMCRGIRALSGMPIVANADFGHTDPKITFPIGGTAELAAGSDGVSLRIVDH